MAGFNDFFKSPETLARKVAGWKAARARAHAGEGFIYLAAIGTSRVKIGFSLNPERRARELMYDGTSKHVRLIAKTPGTWAQEKALHRELQRNQISRSGEIYPRSILSHPAIPEALRSAA